MGTGTASRSQWWYLGILRTTRKLDELEVPAAPDPLVKIAPVGHIDMLVLEQSAELIVTNSRGVQKKAFINRISCVTLREKMEWNELFELRWSRCGAAIYWSQ